MSIASSSRSQNQDDITDACWEPLEGTPEAFNALIDVLLSRSVGAEAAAAASASASSHDGNDDDDWHFVSVLGLDSELLAMLSPDRAVALILLYPTTPELEQYRLLRRVHEDNTNTRDDATTVPIQNIVFLRQLVGGTCGTIAVVHALANCLLQYNNDLVNTALIGLQPRGIYLSDRVVVEINKEFSHAAVQYGKLDITFYRDDIRQSLHIANQTDIPFSIEGKKVVLIDDVLYTGRTIRAALDALLAFGRPEKVELCVLIDRRFSRQLPIQPDYVGKAIDSIISQKVKVLWKDKDGKDEVVILDGE